MPDLDAAARRFLTACTAELMPDVRGEARAVLVDLVHARSADALVDHVHGLLHVVLTEVGVDGDEDEDEDEDEDGDGDESDALLHTLGRVVGTVLDAAAGRGPQPVPPPADERVVDAVVEIVQEKKP